MEVSFQVYLFSFILSFINEDVINKNTNYMKNIQSIGFLFILFSEIDGFAKKYYIMDENYGD